MHIRAEHQPFLTGEKFSPGLVADFDLSAADRELLDRIAWLQNLCRDKRVVHLGCVDHSIEMIDNKRAKGRWLHERLDKVAAHCYGVDLQADGIAYIQKLGFANVSAVDIVAQPDPEITARHWEALVIPEVLEHVDNPVSFLRSIRSHYAHCIDEVILTVPNAFSREIFRLARRGCEMINTDHRYWFTPFTIAKVLTAAGMQVDEIVMLNYRVRKSPWKRWYDRRHPLLRQNIGVRARLHGSAQ